MEGKNRENPFFRVQSGRIAVCKKHFWNSKFVLTLAVSVGLSAILYVLHSLISYILHVYRRKITNRNRKIASIDIKKEDNSLKFDDIVSSIKGTSFQRHTHSLSIYTWFLTFSSLKILSLMNWIFFPLWTGFFLPE